MLSRRRTAEVVRPRQVAMALARQVGRKSYHEIGRRFAGRDHATALHAVRKIEALAAMDAAFADSLANLRESLCQTMT